MLRTYKNHILSVGLIVLLFLLAGCSMPGIGSSSSPSQTLANSATAMSKLKSVHFDLQTTLTVQSSNSTNGITFNVGGHGDAATPDRVSISLASGQEPLLGLISSGPKIYVQIKQGTWYSVNKDSIKDAEQNFFSQSLAARLGQIMTLVQNAKLTDQGQETVNGESLDHITATLDQQTLKSLSSELNGLAPSQDQSALNQIKQAVLDVWIDPSTLYVHQAKLDVVTQVDSSGLKHFTGQQPDSSTAVLPIELKAQVNFSKFNQAVNIQPPANSIPLSE